MFSSLGRHRVAIFYTLVRLLGCTIRLIIVLGTITVTRNNETFYIYESIAIHFLLRVYKTTTICFEELKHYIAIQVANINIVPCLLYSYYAFTDNHRHQNRSVMLCVRLSVTH